MLPRQMAVVAEDALVMLGALMRTAAQHYGIAVLLLAEQLVLSILPVVVLPRTTAGAPGEDAEAVPVYVVAYRPLIHQTWTVDWHET